MDGFFHDLSMQLMATPAASLQALEEVARGRPPGITIKEKYPKIAAMSWPSVLLQEKWCPPAGTPYLAIPREGGRADVVRCRHLVGEVTIEVAQTRYLISVRLAGFQAPKEKTDDKKAEALAKQFLDLPQAPRFQTLGPLQGGQCGRQDPNNPNREDTDWPHWFDLLHWWLEATRISFLTMKASGGPTKEVLTIDPEANRQWFS